MGSYIGFRVQTEYMASLNSLKGVIHGLVFRVLNLNAIKGDV